MDFWCYTFPMLVLTVVFAFDSLAKDMKINKLEQRIRTLEQGKLDWLKQEAEEGEE